jgi:hypothetical protein
MNYALATLHGNRRERPNFMITESDSNADEARHGRSTDLTGVSGGTCPQAVRPTMVFLRPKCLIKADMISIYRSSEL